MRRALFLLVAAALVGGPYSSFAQYPSQEQIRQYAGHREAVGGGSHAVPVPSNWGSQPSGDAARAASATPSSCAKAGCACAKDGKKDILREP